MRTIVAIMAGVILLAAAATGQRVARTEPHNGATDVPIDVGVLRLHFDCAMRTDGWSLLRSDRGVFPPPAGEHPARWASPRCCELRVGRLMPGTTYAVQLNSRSRRGFVTPDGRALPITLVVFTTERARPRSASRRVGRLARYSDPAGRFQFRYPDGWTVQALPEEMGVSLRHGKGATSVLVWPKLKEAKQAIAAFSGQIRSQWKSFDEVRRAGGTVGGRPAAMIEFTGVNLEDRASRGMVAGLAAGGRVFSIARIGPDADYAALQPAWEVLVASFEVGTTAAPARKGSLYRHAIGFSFWHPAGWRVKEQRDYLQIEPPNPAKNAQGAEELYFVIGDRVEGVGVTAAHPQVAQYLDEFVKANLTPSLQRSGGASTMPVSKGEGVILNWKTTSPHTGKTVLARAHAVVIRDHGVALLAFGVEDRVTARDKELRQMFASFGFGEGAKDPALVGVWTLVSTRSIWNNSPFETDYSRARGYNQSKSTLAIQADGTWTQTDVWELLVMGGGTNPITGTTVMLESGPQKSVSTGRWSAGGGVFYRSFENGSWCDDKYRVGRRADGVQLTLEDEKNRTIWTRVRD